jgi:hypothetical protein
LDDGFIVTGGYDAQAYTFSSGIYKMDNSLRWIEVPHNLIIARDHHRSFVAFDDEMTC